MVTESRAVEEVMDGAWWRSLGQGEGACHQHNRCKLCSVVTEQLLSGFLAKCGVTVACSLGWQKLKEKLKQ